MLCGTRSILAALLVGALGVAQADDGHVATSPEEALAPVMKAARETPADERTDESALRREAQSAAAATYGSQAGRVARWQAIIGQLNQRDAELMRSFPFHALYLEGGALQPPILDAGRDISQINSEGTIRQLVDRVYRVTVPARFTHAPLTWRDFLLPDDLRSPAFPRETLLPRDEAEKTRWERVVKESWVTGEAQADEEFRLRVAALNSAFQGMVLYDMLAMRGMVEPPQVVRVKGPPASASEDGRRMEVGYRQDVIARATYFVADPNRWKPVQLRLPSDLLVPNQGAR